MSIRNALRLTSIAALALVVSAQAVYAGPPLLCHPFDIGTAASLPWSGSSSWFDGRSDYRIANLVADTEALLGPSTPVVVRMETLRRAAIYASRDPHVAAALLDRLAAKATASKSAGRADARALMDVAYATEALRQIAQIGGVQGYKQHAAAIAALVLGRDGTRDMAASLAASPDDPALAFAAALIASDKDRGAYLAHAQKARAGASRDALVARNLNHIS
jgi:hypothetical protein